MGTPLWSLISMCVALLLVFESTRNLLLQLIDIETTSPPFVCWQAHPDKGAIGAELSETLPPAGSKPVSKSVSKKSKNKSRRRGVPKAWKNSRRRKAAELDAPKKQVLEARSKTNSTAIGI
ncbi:hypothetical protein B0J13DRAFT_523352 [Dactylonectria estremocensis]|uniref:Uncharacterized protein n=1 Tax=Dactylonectria estremocensis TaxID=1079267 RepID=A0A9P9J6P1_9HYPO|nr:hypothetical protein B0J13DRAFT_523352 [Dactylonectria estremocensis]